MAIDLIITPLSKYWSGDYITPVMESTWEMGANYNIVTPQGTTTLPKGTPYGGEHAKAERKGLLDFVNSVLDALPIDGLSSSSWDDSSDSVFEFERIDHESLGVLFEEAEHQFACNPGLIGRLKGQKRKHCHLTSACIFLPVEFDPPYDLEGKVLGSLPVAFKELQTGKWSEGASDARASLGEFVEKAIELNCPLIIDM